MSHLPETALLFNLPPGSQNALMSLNGGTRQPLKGGTEMSSSKKDNARKDRPATVDLTGQLTALRKMTVGQLREKYREVFGEPTHSRNKDYLRKKVAWRIQELAEGGLSDRAKARIKELGAGVPVRWRSSGNGGAAAATAETTMTGGRDPRLPEPGTVITRAYKDTEHRITVLEDGFEYQGERFPSLSKIAREITGTNWNGFLFFGLQSRARNRAGEGEA